MMFTIGIMPPSGKRLSCMLLTAPQEASVVIVVKREESVMPNRTSLPSILPPAWIATWSRFNGKARESRIFMALDRIHREQTGQEQDPHDGEDCPALALTANHPAEDVGEPCTY